MKWEYKILHVDAKRPTGSRLPEDLNLKFDELGEDGWELVKFEQILTSGFFFLFFGWASSTQSFVAVFKKGGPPQLSPKREGDSQQADG